MTEILAQGPIFIICLAVLLGIVVIIHELGHYLVGRWYGAAVESFSVGFGAPIFETKDSRGTRWRVNWIPLGGFVKFVGESQMPSDVGVVEEGLVGKPYSELGVGARSLVALAGPAANFLLSILLFAIIIGVHGVTENRITVLSVLEDKPADIAGFEPGDIIMEIEGKPVTHSGDIVLAVSYATGEPVEFLLERAGEVVPVTVTPERVVRENQVGQRVPQGTIGIGLGAIPDATTHRNVGPIEAVGHGIQSTGEVIGLTTKLLGRIVTGKEPVSTLSGPVAIGDTGRRIFNLTLGNEQVSFWQGAQAFFWTMIGMCAAISIGIGFFNLLPLPVLDGGHLVFNAYEAITGSVMPAKVQEMALMAGLGLLLTMFVLITWGDILETGLFGGLSG